MFAAIETLLPHRAPMRFVDALIDCTDEVAITSTCFADKPFAVVGGKVSESALVECVAQTVAAALGQRSKSQGKGSALANVGMLVAVSDFKIVTRPAAEKILQIEVRNRKRLGPMLMVSAKISCDGQIVAEGDLSLYA